MVRKTRTHFVVINVNSKAMLKAPMKPPFPHQGILQGTCPHCGLIVLRNDIALTLSHEVPECQFFKDMMAKGGEHATKVEVLNKKPSS